MESNTVELKKIRYEIAKLISTKKLEDLGGYNEIVTWFDSELNALFIKIHGWNFGETENVKRVEVSYPKDWWQSIKDRFFPTWLLKKYPVIYETVFLVVDAVYPTFQPSIPFPPVFVAHKETSNDK